MTLQRVAADRLPVAPPGISIGLFGGSFDPPHAGHLMVSEVALTRLGLDRVWWLVSPGNPLKRSAPGSGLEARIAAARRLTDDPRVTVTGLEAAIGRRYTVDTIRFLRRRFPRTRFVWLMGADNLGQFHRWKGWERIAALVPIAVIDRPGRGFSAFGAPAAKALAPFRIRETDAAALAFLRPPAWAYVHGPKMPVSSTALRLLARKASPT